MTTQTTEIKTYCLGYTHEKCETCQHERNWQTLNQLPDALRISIQADATSIDITKCRLTNMGEYKSSLE